MFTAEDRNAFPGISAEGWDRLTRYAELLEGARAVGLVGFADIPAELLRSLLFLNASPPNYETTADVGTGAGLPGLAIACASGRAVTLIEPRQKAVGFLSTCIEQLGLPCETLHMGAEQAAGMRREKFDLVFARAVAHPPTSLELCAPLAAVGGRVVVTLGTQDSPALPENQLEALGLGTPELQEQAGPRGLRYRLLVSDKVAATSDRFPRRPGVARKRPLA